MATCGPFTARSSSSAPLGTLLAAAGRLSVALLVVYFTNQTSSVIEIGRELVRHNAHRSALSRGRLEIRFLGRGAPVDRADALRQQPEAPDAVAFLKQVHSNRIVEASAGSCGEADGLWTSSTGLALCVSTADCVPVVIADQEHLAVVHAGWRGIVAGIVHRAVGTLGGGQRLAAWTGPAIGPCCYEVGDDVADLLRAAGDESVVSSGRGRRPHVDLAATVGIQLAEAGVAEINIMGPCTRCRSDELWSYRSCGPGAGRNLTFAWLGDAAATSASDRFPGPGEYPDQPDRS